MKKRVETKCAACSGRGWVYCDINDAGPMFSNQCPRCGGSGVVGYVDIQEPSPELESKEP